MACSSLRSTVSTYIYYQGRNYQCFDLDDRTTASIEIVRTCIAKALEVSTLSSDDTIEIKTDDGNYVILNNYYLINKNPWKSCFNGQELVLSNKKVSLRIISKTELESNAYPVYVSTTQFINETETNDRTTTSTTNKDQFTLPTTLEDVEQTFFDNLIASANNKIGSLRLPPNYDDLTDVERLRHRAQNSSTPLKFIYDVAPKQRLVYPSGKDSVLIQANKRTDDEQKPVHPVLQISTDYVNYLRAGGPLELISIILNKVGVHDQSLEFCLAPYVGFWPPKRASRPSMNTPFSNPFFSPITYADLAEIKTDTGESVYTTELLLRLIHAVNSKYDQNPQPLVPFDELFILSGAQPVPSHYDFSLYPVVATMNERKILNKTEYYILCALRSDPTHDFYDWYSKCVSTMFTVEPRTSSNVTKPMNNPGSRERSRSCLTNSRRENAKEHYSN